MVSSALSRYFSLNPYRDDHWNDVPTLRPYSDTDSFGDLDGNFTKDKATAPSFDQAYDDARGLDPGGMSLSLEEDASGGMGRHLGVTSCTLLIVGRIIGTGIFSNPATVFTSVHSVGASLMLWTLGFVLAFSGLFVWLELGSMFPRSGGEKVYLEAIYQRPRYLATVVFASQAILLGFTVPGCIVFAQNILISAGHTADRWVVRAIAVGVMTFVTLIHGLTPRAGIWLMNVLSIFKIFILLFIVITGWVVLGGHTRVEDPQANFRNAFAGSSHSSNDYVTGLFKVLNTYQGWSNVNYVLSEVKDPVRTLLIAGPLGLGICSVLYVMANVSYFAAATKEEINKSGVTIASMFFGNVFGTQAQKALTVFVALSALGYNVLAVTFSQSKINQEVAKAGVPMPFGNRFWASTWPFKAPLPALILHWIISTIVILGPPPRVAYPFIINVEGYPQQIINLFVAIGLFYLRWKKPNLHRPFKVWWPVALFFLAAVSFLVIAPFIRPSNKVGESPPLPYWLHCIVGIAVMIFGVLYWFVWRVGLPKAFGYVLVPRKERLKDGTVVRVFSKVKVR